MNEFFSFQTSEENLISVFQQNIIKQLIKVVDDKLEKHRELVLIILDKWEKNKIKN